MLNEVQFQRSTRILIKAYLDDTLQIGSITRCPVGILIAAANGYTPLPGSEKRWQAPDGTTCFPNWPALFVTHKGAQQKCPALIDTYPALRREIEATGYSWRELAKMEKAFEVAARAAAGNRDERILAGLMATVQIICNIHQAPIPII